MTRTPSISLVVPTLRRSESLRRALGSVAAQTGVADALIEVVVVDNSPDGSARAVVSEAAAGSPTPVRYVGEPRPGVATARNTGLKAATGELIAFLDDDQEAPAGWLAALLETHLAFGADVTFGPVAAVVPPEGAWAEAHFQRLFSRPGPMVSGPTKDLWGCGNAMLTRATALPGPAPFNTRHDQVGGEDDELFSDLKASGGRFAWAADAVVLEHPASHRLTMGYAARRAFAFGQGPSQTAVQQRDWLALARWTFVGAAQTAVFAPVTALLWLLRRPGWPAGLDRTMRGLGKVLWIEALEPRFYGQAEVARTAPASASGS